ncbi:hypothetical protein EB093_07115 [bacterium]|nr:hypothetical protein [bacterium]
MTDSGHAEECDVCGGLIEDRQKYRDIPIRARECVCDSSSTIEPSFTHWNRTIRSDGDTLSRF